MAWETSVGPTEQSDFSANRGTFKYPSDSSPKARELAADGDNAKHVCSNEFMKYMPLVASSLICLLLKLFKLCHQLKMADEQRNRKDALPSVFMDELTGNC